MWFLTACFKSCRARKTPFFSFFSLALAQNRLHQTPDLMFPVELWWLGEQEQLLARVKPSGEDPSATFLSKIIVWSRHRGWAGEEGWGSRGWW